MIKFISIIAIICSISYAKVETLTLFDGIFKDNIYKGNIENGKLNGEGVVLCMDKNRIFVKGTFKDNQFIKGTLHSCIDLTKFDDIEFGIINKIKYDRKDKPYFNNIIYGNFNANNNDVASLFNEGQDIDLLFYNTQSFDKAKGKTRLVKEYNDAAVIDGTLYLKNNVIKEIKTNFYIVNMKFLGGAITIKGDDFIMEGYTKNNEEINKFTFDGVIKWNNNTEYYVSNMKFKKDLLLRIDSFKKLATPIVSSNENNQNTNILNNLKDEKDSKKQILNIVTDDVVLKNSNNYNDEEKNIIDLEKK